MRRLAPFAVLGLLTVPCFGQIDFIGFSYNCQIGATSRGLIAGAAGEVMTRLDGLEHSGWGRVNWPVLERRIESVYFVVQDQDGLTAETFDIVLYGEDALNPGFPDLANPIPFATGLAGPTSTGGPVANVRTITVPGGVGVPIVNECSDIFVSWRLTAAPTWPADGVSLNIVLGYAPNTTFTVFDTPGPVQGGTPPPAPAEANSHGLSRTGLGAAVYNARRMMFLDIAHVGSGGVGLAETNQTSFTASNNPPPAGWGPCIGTASFMSGTNPDVAGFNPGRADNVSMEYFKTGLGTGNLVLFLMEFDRSCVREMPVSMMVPGSSGWTCMVNPTVVATVVSANNEACHYTSIPAAVRPLLLGLPVRQQAAAIVPLTTGLVVLDASPCDHMVF